MNSEADFIDAIRNGDEDRLAELLRLTGDTSDLLQARISDPQPTNHAIGFSMTLLQFASFRPWKGGDPAGVLIDHGAKVDLHSACGLGLTDRIEEILAADPDAIVDQVDGYYPLQFAISAARPAAIRCLMNRGDDPNRNLQKVAYFGWEDDAREQDFTPWKPIHMAALWGFDSARIPVVESLAAAGADFNAVSPLDGYQPIHLVAMPNRVDMIRFLVSSGVDVDGRTVKCDEMDLPAECDGPVSGYGCTPLMVAAAEGFPEATACLLELGADPNLKNDCGQTASDLAHRRFWEGQPYDQVIDLLG